jgi:hypothetical protein
MPKAACSKVSVTRKPYWRAPDEVGNVVRIYGQWNENVAGEVGNAPPVFRRQRPELAAGEGPPVVERCLSPQDALTKNIAVALVIVRGNTCTEPISLIVAAKGCRAGLAFGHQSDARLACGDVELAQGIGIVLVRQGAEGSENVAAGGVGAIHRFTRQKAPSRGDRAALEVDCVGVRDLLLNLGLFGLYGGGQ